MIISLLSEIVLVFYDERSVRQQQTEFFELSLKREDKLMDTIRNT
jgi:hypothetical protein